MPKQCRYRKKQANTNYLSDQKKDINRQLARKRIRIEHLFARLKVFKILAHRYHNRRQNIELRFSLIAAIYNLQFNDFSKSCIDLHPLDLLLARKPHPAQHQCSSTHGWNPSTHTHNRHCASFTPIPMNAHTRTPSPIPYRILLQ